MRIGVSFFRIKVIIILYEGNIPFFILDRNFITENKSIILIPEIPTFWILLKANLIVLRDNLLDSPTFLPDPKAKRIEDSIDSLKKRE